MTKATIDTDKGAIEIELYDKGAPKAAANFVELAKKGFYDGVVFHRLVPGFVIQGGDGEYGHIDKLDRGRLGTGGPGYKFADEPFEGDYVRGAVAMANAGPNTNGSQFFICLEDLSGGQAAQEVHALRPRDRGHGRRRRHRRLQARQPGPADRADGDAIGQDRRPRSSRTSDPPNWGQVSRRCCGPNGRAIVTLPRAVARTATQPCETY